MLLEASWMLAATPEPVEMSPVRPRPGGGGELCLLPRHCIMIRIEPVTKIHETN
eukprot:COSAG01_NODE_37204_length_507_cov_0.566176_1_plen_54_part_00